MADSMFSDNVNNKNKRMGMTRVRFQTKPTSRASSLGMSSQLYQRAERLWDFGLPLGVDADPLPDEDEDGISSATVNYKTPSAWQCVIMKNTHANGIIGRSMLSDRKENRLMIGTRSH
jgi:hypothetical protein